MTLDCSYCGPNYPCGSPVMDMNPEAAIPCKRCGGTGRGRAVEGNRKMNNAPGSNAYPCYFCHGHGKIPAIGGSREE